MVVREDGTVKMADQVVVVVGQGVQAEVKSKRVNLVIAEHMVLVIMVTVAVHPVAPEIKEVVLAAVQVVQDKMDQEMMAVLAAQEKRFQTLVLMVYLVSSPVVPEEEATVVVAPEEEAAVVLVEAIVAMVAQERLIQAVAEVVLILDHRALEGVV
jgi:hypothetical protein